MVISNQNFITVIFFQTKENNPKGSKIKQTAKLMEIRVNNRMGICTHVKCAKTDTVGDLLKIIAAQTGTIAEKIQLKKGNINLNPKIVLDDYEISHGCSVDLYHR